MEHILVFLATSPFCLNVMYSQQNYPTSVTKLPSLELTLNILLNRQEKDWGYFQVIKEKEFYSLYIPTLDSFKLYKNPKSENFKGYWRNYRSDILLMLKVVMKNLISFCVTAANR
ncbi:MAG: hypothetical protein HC764_13450 [Pleurocapsa sp. CRU_1_2]|nr:hypothetical protein [Pleurocapsa sp. CRU_1_2]